MAANVINVAVTEFLERFRGFRRNPAAHVLRVAVRREDVGALREVVLVEGRMRERKSPFLVLDVAHANQASALDDMCRAVTQGYGALRETVTAETREVLPPLEDLSGDASRMAGSSSSLAHHLLRFTDCTAPAFDPPLVCWFPTDALRASHLTSELIQALKSLVGRRIQLVFGDDPANREIADLVEGLAGQAVTLPFALGGIAAVEAESPASDSRTAAGRPKSPEAELPAGAEPRASMAAEGSPAVLSESEGERLRIMTLEAEAAASKGEHATAIERLKAACRLCEETRVPVQHSLMRLVLASYLVRFERGGEAEQEYRAAASLAEGVNAHQQAAQAKMGLASLLLGAKRLEEAGQVFEEAAAAAAICSSSLLVIQARHRAGLCQRQLGREEEAILQWRSALETAHEARPEEAALDSFEHVSRELKQLLEGGRAETDRTAPV
jgi:tetratricopeptide (TPR) repeat protein